MIENDTIRDKTIHDLVGAAGVSAKTLKKWERENKIPTACRNGFRWRIYSEREIAEIVRLIKSNNYFSQSNQLDEFIK